MEWITQNIFTTPVIMESTINTVSLSSDFKSLIYIFIAIVLVLGTLLFISKKSRPFDALKKSIIVSFFAAGLLYAVHADIGWTTWLARDLGTYGGLSTDEKLLRMEGGLYDFVRTAKQIIPDDYVMYSTDQNVPTLANYYLLPLRERGASKYIIVVEDTESSYDLNTRTLTRGTVKTPNAAPVLLYSKNAYILLLKKP